MASSPWDSFHGKASPKIRSHAQSVMWPECGQKLPSVAKCGLRPVWNGLPGQPVAAFPIELYQAFVLVHQPAQVMSQAPFRLGAEAGLDLLCRERTTGFLDHPNDLRFSCCGRLLPDGCWILRAHSIRARAPPDHWG